MINELFKIFSGHPGVVLYNVLQIVNIFAGYDGEAKSPMPYSKFAHDFASRSPKKEFMVPSRLGMLTIYLPAMITVMMYLFALPLVSGNVKPGLACWMLLVHFVKRNLEVLFLHKYSGSTPLNAAILIGFVYALASLMICSVSSPIPCEACSHVGQGRNF